MPYGLAYQAGYLVDVANTYIRSRTTDNAGDLGRTGGLVVLAVRHLAEPTARECPGTSLGLPAASTGMSVKQPKDHLRGSAPRSHPSRQVTAPPGLSRDI